MSPLSLTSTAAGVVLQEQLIRQRLEVGRRFQRLRTGTPGTAETNALETRPAPPQGQLDPPVEPRFALQRCEEVGKAADGLRIARKQEAAGFRL